MTSPAAIQKKNQANLKAVDNGGTVTYLYTGVGRDAVILIGAGHDSELVKRVKKSRPYSGEIMVTKGTITNPGQLKVTGCKSNRSEFETALAKFTKKKVVYV